MTISARVVADHSPDGVTATFSKVMRGSSIAFAVKDGAGHSVPGTVAYDGGRQTATPLPGHPHRASRNVPAIRQSGRPRTRQSGVPDTGDGSGKSAFTRSTANARTQASRPGNRRNPSVGRDASLRRGATSMASS